MDRKVSMELVSVVVPIYNVEEYLDRCVQSIRKQTYKKLEIILVDDGSPDLCGKMCDEYTQQDQRIKVIHKKNGGLSDARNVGAEAATGKYLLFVDSDDYIEPELVRKTVEAAEKYQSDIVLFDYKRLEPDGSIEVCSIQGVPEKQTFCLDEYPQVMIESISAWNKLFSRTFFVESQIRFPIGYYYEDLGSSPKYFLESKRLSYVQEAFYNYVIRDGSIMSETKEEKSYHDRCMMADGVIKYYQEKNAYQKYKSELEYLLLFHVYFIPAKEILFRKGDRKYIQKFRDFVRNQDSDYTKNKYIKNMSKKEKIQFYMIDHGQYWVVNFLSWLRKSIRG